MSKRKQKREEVFFKSVAENQQAMIDGPIKKKWTKYDIKNIRPITEAQEQMFAYYQQGKHIVAHGSPGTGKSLLSLFMAISDILDPSTPYHQLLIIRSAVATRDQGFLPGTLAEKQSCFETPYHDIFEFLFGRKSTYEDMKRANIIQFMSTSYVRGLTWDNSVIFVDETENCNFHEINSIVTRVGNDSKIILAGDIKQSDLLKSTKDICGMGRLIDIAGRMDEIATVQFTADDIVRSSFVKSWIIASDQ